jgi:hypothetical protein
MLQLTKKVPWCVPGVAQAFGTPIVQGIPPYCGLLTQGTTGNGPLLYQTDAGYKPVNGQWGQCNMSVTSMEYITGTTAHTIAVLRPLNYVTVKTAVAANATSIILNQNPGTYSTNYNYGLPNNATGQQTVACVANLVPTTTHYYAVQLVDGTWFFDLIGAWTAGTLTVTTTANVPNVTGGGIAAGAPFFFFGAIASVDPATGFKQYQKQTILASAGQTTQVFQDPAGDGLVSTLHPGDPMLFYSLNPTATGAMAGMSGYHWKP